MDIHKLLKNHYLFSHCDKKFLENLAQQCIVHELSKGGTLFEEGTPNTGIYVVLDGLVRLARVLPNGSERILRFFGPGESFAEAALFSDGKHPANAFACIRTTYLMIPGEPIIHEMKNSWELTSAILASLFARLKFHLKTIEMMGIKSIPLRLGVFLHEYIRTSQSNGDGWVQLNLQVTRTNLAAHLGVAPETASRVLHSFAKKGLLRLAPQRILAINAEKFGPYMEDLLEKEQERAA